MNKLRELVDLVASVDIDQEIAYLVLSGVVIALVALVLVARNLKKTGLAKFGTRVVVLIVLGTTVEGAWKFAGYIGADGLDRIFPAVVFESIGFQVYWMAKQYADRFSKGPGRYGRRLYYIGAIAGCVVATSGSNVGEIGFRIAMPLLAAWLINMELEPLTEDAPESKTSWNWTPRRIGIEIGAIIPGEKDAVTIDRDRTVRRMTKLRFKIQAGGWLTVRRTARYKAWSLLVDDTILDDVQANVTRAEHAVTRTAPVPLDDAGTPGPSVSQSPGDRKPVPPVPGPLDASGTPGPQSPAASPLGDRSPVPPVPAEPVPSPRSPVPTLTGTRIDQSPVPVQPVPEEGRPAGSLADRVPVVQFLTDEQAIEIIKGLPREVDGTVPVKRAAKALGGCGVERARRLVRAAGLLREAKVNGSKVV